MVEDCVLISWGKMANRVNWRHMRSTYFASVFFSSLIGGLSFAQAQVLEPETCSPLRSPVKYSLEKDESIVAVLKTVQLQPVVCVGCSLDQMLSENGLGSTVEIRPGVRYFLPFKCEEQLKDLMLIQDKDFRILTFNRNMTTEAGPSAASSVLGEGEEEGAGEGQMTEELKYRTTCEGEWVGNECIRRNSLIETEVTGVYARYDAVDATTRGTGVLLSKMNPGLTAGWTNYWNNSVSTTLKAEIVNNQLHPETAQIPIEQDKQLLTRFFGKVKYEYKSFGISLGIAQGETLFYRYNSQLITGFLVNTGVVVSSVPVTETNVELSYVLAQRGKLRVDVNFRLINLSGGNTAAYSVKPGSGYELSSKILHDTYKEQYFYGILSYSEVKQNTSILEQKVKAIGFNFGYAWKIKDLWE